MRKPIGKGLLATAATAAIVISAGTALGAEGDLDPTFSSDGKLTLDVAEGGRADGLAIDGQSRVYLAGNYDPPGGADSGDFAVARFLSDGSPDTSFSGDGIVTLDGTGDGAPGDLDDANAVAIDKSGRVLVAGFDGGAVSEMMIARFSNTGVLDTTYGGGDGIATLDIGAAGGDSIDDIQLDGNDKLAVGGTSNLDFAVALFTVDGAPDTSYGGGDGHDTLNVNSLASDDRGQGIAIDSAGRVVLAGFTSLAANEENFAVARWTTAGVLDTTFSNDLPTPGRHIELMASEAAPDQQDLAEDVAIGASDKIIVSGFAEITGQGTQAAFLALTSTGAPDTSFSGDGKAFVGASSDEDRATGIALDGLGKLVFSGSSGPLASRQFLVGRLNPDGTPDNKFSGDGVQVTDIAAGEDFGEAVAIDPKTRRIVVGGRNGDFATGDFAAARYEAVPRCKGKVPTLAGTSKDDKLGGTAKADVIWTGPGKDQIKGNKGKDTICADTGNDNVVAGPGNDIALGGTGADRLSGNKGKDVLSGNKGKDTLLGGPGKDKLKGGPGKDLVKQGGVGKKKKKP